jgi:hypothetical protein
MHSRFATACFLGAFLGVLSGTAFALESFDFASTRERSMGGTHVALADDYSVLLDNPAGLASAPAKFSAAELGLHAIGPVFDIANIVVGGGDPTTAITDFLAASGYKLYAGMGITGPLAFGYTGGGLGFGLFNASRLLVNVSNISSINVTAAEDLLLTGGYALRFDLGKGNGLALGVSAKGYVRGAISPTMGIVEAMGKLSNPLSLLTDNFALTTGIGLDAGIRWDWNNQIAAAIACRDLFSPAIVTEYAHASDFVSALPGTTRTDTLDRSLDFGLMWAPPLGRLGQVIDSLVFALDYRDILDLASPLPRNPILNVGLGLEARFLEIVTLRAGIDEALLSAGLGLDLGVFKLNLAAYGAELGLDPGNRPYYNLLIDFDFKY